jgi:predicted carbohydrate-binding protein with CBM5 and CBM33 domain
MNRRRTLAAVILAATVTTGLIVLTPDASQAHGATTSPGSRTYLCFEDGHWTGGDLEPRNPACQRAVAAGGKQPLWDWFGVLRSDGAGRTRGFIPDGELCSGGSAKYAAYDAPADDWPATRLTSGAPWTVHYNAWAAHPGQFRLYVTRDGYDPRAPLTWDSLESEPFSVWDETVPNGQGEYYWDVQLPAGKTGRHIIYSVWQRSDSAETFYGCADVVFDGGNGEVIGIPDGPQPTPTPTVPTPTVTTTPTSTPTSHPGTCMATVAVLSSWPGGYQATVTVMNHGGTVNPWSIAFDLPAGVRLESGWNADYRTEAAGTGTRVTATAPSWNRDLTDGESVALGFVATGPASPPPSAVTLSGTTCAATST